MTSHNLTSFVTTLPSLTNKKSVPKLFAITEFDCNFVSYHIVNLKFTSACKMALGMCHKTSEKTFFSMFISKYQTTKSIFPSLEVLSRAHHFQRVKCPIFFYL